ncbi:NPS protein, partial [Pitta sordida]|nr:NPS protein [Pitta sordida]
SLCRLKFVLVLWISATLVCSGFPLGPSMSNNAFSWTCQLSDHCLVLLKSCLAKVGRNEELDLLRNALGKRSFRNGVGSGMKKTSFRRAK